MVTKLLKLNYLLNWVLVVFKYVYHPHYINFKINTLFTPLLETYFTRKCSLHIRLPQSLYKIKTIQNKITNLVSMYTYNR